MVADELADGRRVAQLLSSEVHGHERGGLGRLRVVDADPDVEPSTFGAFAYALEFRPPSADGRAVEADGDATAAEGDVGDPVRVADAYVHPDRAHLEFRGGVETAATVGRREGLRVRPKAVEPPRTLVFVENGAEVKAALRVVRAVADDLLEEFGERR